MDQEAEKEVAGENLGQVVVETVATIRAVARMPVPITVFLAKRVTFLESKEVVS